MSLTSKSLVFFGSGPVAAASLAGILKNGLDVEAVVTKPRPVHHRGDVPVLKLAQEKKLTIFTAATKAELKDLLNEQSFSSLVGLVVDYGVIIPQEVISHFPKGIINSHFSLLPQWRGPDPITFALLSGQSRTGVSLMLIEPTLDTGQLLAQATYDISADETILSLTDNLIDLSNQTIKNILPLYLEDRIQPFDQDKEQKPTYSRLLTKGDGVVDWKKSAVQIEREVRAYLGWPKSRTNIFGRDVIITKSRVAANEHDGALVKTCGQGFLEIVELIAPSGRTMSGADFMRGYKN